MEYFHLLCAADANYGPWAGVMVSSVLARDHGRPVHIHLLSDGVAARDLSRLAAMAERAGGKFSVYDARATLADLGPISSEVLTYLTRASVARLMFDRFLSLRAGRLLYCDSDIVCVGSLRELWLTDLGDAIAGAIANEGLPGRISHPRNRELGLPEHHRYVNSGVVLIDIERWRDADIGNRAATYIRDNAKHILVPDQDALNAVLGDRIMCLSPRWNFQTDGRPLPEGQSVALIHYAGPAKPWFAGYRRFYAREFRQAKRNSPWRWTPPVIPHARIFQRYRRSLDKRRRSLLRLFGHEPAAPG